MSRILVSQQTFPDLIETLTHAGHEIDYHPIDAPLPADELKQRLASVDALIALLTDRIDAAVMDAAPQLRIIANVAVGYDNIDVEAATHRGILVTNTPGVLTETTADLAFGLLLAAARRLAEADAYMRAGQYQRWTLLQPHLGLDVYGKTLGIVGLGRIGEAVARRAALGFGMTVLYTARSPKPALDQALGARHVAFETLLAESDFISIHTPLTPETHHLFTLRQFQQMRRHAILVNTARGPIINEADLVAALDQGLIAGVALDVFEDEPRMHLGLRRHHKHVIVAPHIGSATVETRRRMAQMAVDNVIAALTGQRPPNLLNPAALDQ